MDSPSDALRERLSDCERDCENERNWLWLLLFDIERSMLSERDFDHERSTIDSLLLSERERDSDALPLFDLPDHDCDFD